MKTVINQHLFRHRETASSAFNNLCTVIHKLAVEGVYAGEVSQGKRVLGGFRLRYDKKTESSQVNIDLSAFDLVYAANTPGLKTSTEFAVGQDGFVVFFASAYHNDLAVTLTKVDDKKDAPGFDSRRIGKGDLVVFRLWQPGSYTITNEAGGQRAALTVLKAEAGKYRNPATLEPVMVTLSEGGFEPARIEQSPVQALVIRVETAADLSLKSED